MASASSTPSCAGVIVFSSCDWQAKVAIVLQDEDNYSFPKGGRLKRETVLRNALRELREETGLREEQIELLPSSVFVDETKSNGAVRVRYFVARLRARSGLEPKLAAENSNEIKHASWVTLTQANRLLIARRSQVLCKAHELVCEHFRPSANVGGAADADADQPLSTMTAAGGAAGLAAHQTGRSNSPTDSVVHH